MVPLLSVTRYGGFMQEPVVMSGHSVGETPTFIRRRPALTWYVVPEGQTFEESCRLQF